MQERQTIADEVMMSADSTSTEIAVPEPLLRDSMDITIVAEFGKLEPVRVRIDGSEELRYWVEEGDTLSLKAANDFTLGLYLDRLTLQVDGHSLPTDIRTAQNEVVYSREAILNFLRSQLESAVNR